MRTRAELDLHNVTLVGESMGAVLAVTTAAGLPERVRRVSGVPAPGVGTVIAGAEPKPALREDYADELLRVGRRPGYPAVTRGVYQALPNLTAARSRHPEVKASVHLLYGEKDWSRPSDREANKQLLPAADFTQVPHAGHFIALERPDAPADLLNAVA